MFEGPVAATGKNRGPNLTESEETEPQVAVVSGSKPVAVTVLLILTFRKTGENRL